jgi:hypothetical protein
MKRMPGPAKRSSFFSAERPGNSGDLFPAERAGRTARRKEIDEILHLQTTHGGNREASPSWRLPSRGPVKRSKTDVVCLIANTAARTGHGGNRRSRIRGGSAGPSGRPSATLTAVEAAGPLCHISVMSNDGQYELEIVPCEKPAGHFRWAIRKSGKLIERSDRAHGSERLGPVREQELGLAVAVRGCRSTRRGIHRS